MADIICIDTGTYREGINKLGDIVDVLEDGNASGAAYSSFNVVRVEGMTVKEVKAEIAKKTPKTAIAHRLNAAKNIWSFEQPEEKSVWQDPLDSKWKELSVNPKYKVSISGLKAADLVSLKSKDTSKEVKTTILGKLIDRISAETDNKATEMTSLNS
jgi:hypothetical protein